MNVLLDLIAAICFTLAATGGVSIVVLAVCGFND